MTFLLIILRIINVFKILHKNIQLAIYYLELSKVIIFSDKWADFLEIIKVFLDGRISICICELVLLNDKKWVCKNYLYINHVSHDKLDQGLTFNDNVSDVCKKACRKNHARAIITPYINLPKIGFWNFFFLSQLNYCVLVFILHSK